MVAAVLRRLAVPALLAGIGGFSMTCGASMEAGTYAPAPGPVQRQRRPADGDRKVA